MKPSRRVFIVGGASSTYLGKGHPEFIHRRHPEFGTRQNPDLEAHLATAVSEAFAVTGVSPEAVQKAYLGNFVGERFVDQAHLGAMLPRVEPGLDGIPIARTEAACASGGCAVLGCVDALAAGYDVALAAGVEIETNVSGRDGVSHIALAAHHATQSTLDNAVFPHLFARRTKAYKEAYDATGDDLARVVVKAYGNARRNPKALNRAAEMSFEFASTVSSRNRLFLDDLELRPHMRLSDCTAFTDGASAVVLATEDGLARLGIDPRTCVELLAYGHTVAALGAETDPTRMANMARAAQVAYRDSGLGPDAIQLAEVHDCFSISELQQYEAIGLCAPGEAPRLLAEGYTAIDGAVPVNPGGGLLGAGHPIGATGVRMVAEVWRQMKGRCGDYQVSHRPEIGLTANLGGDDRTAVVTLLRDVR